MIPWLLRRLTSAAALVLRGTTLTLADAPVTTLTLADASVTALTIDDAAITTLTLTDAVTN